MTFLHSIKKDKRPVFPSQRQEAHKSLTRPPQVSDSGNGSQKQEYKPLKT